MTRPSALRRITAALRGSSQAPGRSRLAVRTRDLPAPRRIAAAILGVPHAPPVAGEGVVLAPPEKAAVMPAPASPLSRKWKQIVYVLLAAVAVPACLWLTAVSLTTSNTCGAVNGLDRVGGECVGVSGGGYDFGTPEISDVSRAIAEENSAIEDERYVTVAVVLPLKSDQRALRQQMRSDLQGAYLGQRGANEGAGTLKIRLVLANPGRDYGQQEKVVDTLLKMADSRKDRLRAVTGFNASTDAVGQAVKRLTQHRIPVLASPVGGDEFANEGRENEAAKQRYPGLARINPTHQEAAQALADFNSERDRQYSNPFLVSDNRDDAYTKSLKEAFAGIKKNGPAPTATASFVSPSVDEPAIPRAFADAAQKICASKADTVYFAGRAVHLPALVRALSRADCLGRHITIITGPDAATLSQSMTERDWAALRGSDGEFRVTLQYAAPAHPDAWRTELSRWRKNHDAKPPQYLTEPQTALNTMRKRIESTRSEGVWRGAAPDLEDSRTTLAYDGLITIGSALHNAEAGAGRAPNLEDVRNQWSLLSSQNRVKGASGLICLTNDGNPYDKPVSVVELDPGTRGRDKPRFLGLGWPTGQGQPQNCVIPSPQ